jgi:hypothetical protein
MDEHGDQGEEQDGPGEQGQPGDDQPGDQPGDDQGEGDGEVPGNPGDQPGDQPGQGQDGDETESTEGTESEGSPGRKPAPGESGSCSDGQQRPWELGDEDGEGQPGDSDEPAGVDEHDQDQIVQQVAERIEKSQGQGSGGMRAFANSVLHPKIDPRRLLMRAVQAHTENIVSGGGGRFSYRRPARRQGTGGLIRPRSFRTVPRILVILDTSGSMDQRDLGLGLGLVAKVLSGLNLRDGVRVITGDSGANWAERVFDHSKIELHGRGGTDMGKIITEADEAESVDLIICVTDGVTPWPMKKPKAPLVVCLTREECGYHPVPLWADRVNLRS